MSGFEWHVNDLEFFFINCGELLVILKKEILIRIAFTLETCLLAAQKVNRREKYRYPSLCECSLFKYSL